MRLAYRFMINLCGPVARCWPMSPPSISTAGWSPMSAAEGAGQDGRFPPRPCDRQGRLRAQRSSAVERAAAVRPGTVHISDSYEELVIGCAQLSGHIPERPFLLVGQMTTADPTRSPEGTESLWAYTHVPQRVLGDAGGNLTGSWDTDEAERFADRMQDRIEQRAPGFSDRILARRILTPFDMERRNASLIGGSINGGTAALDQQLIFRPIPGMGRASTPIRGLYLASSSAHPGGAVHGACGMNAARAALAHARLTPRRAHGGRSSEFDRADRPPPKAKTPESEQHRSSSKAFDRLTGSPPEAKTLESAANAEPHMRRIRHAPRAVTRSVLTPSRQSRPSAR